MIRDIREEIRKIKNTRKELRNFGLVIGGVLVTLGAFSLFKGEGGYPYFLAFGAGLCVLGLLWPAVLRPLYRAWMALSVVLGWFMTRVILSVLFYLILTPIGAAARLSGKRFLDGVTDPGDKSGPEAFRKSYWHYRDEEKRHKKDYLRQF